MRTETDIKFKILEVNCLGEIAAGKVVPFTRKNPPTRFSVIVPIDFPYSAKQLDSIIICGDSMSADRIFDGDKIIFKKHFERSDVMPHKICLVRIISTNDLIVRRVVLTGNSILLKPSNPAYTDQRFDVEDIEILGIVVINPIFYL